MAVSSTSYSQGESGNPNGRPKKSYSISETFREMFCADPSLKKKLARKILDKALVGDMSACKLIWSYMDGLPDHTPEFYDRPLPIPIMGGLSGLVSILTTDATSSQVASDQARAIQM